MIIKLELTNFQKHSNLTLDFTQGVNVIYGQTDAGKSCIRRALSWVFFNVPRGDVIRKTETKKTSAKVTFDNEIQVERIKSNTVNAYIIHVEGKEKRFDAIGKDIPEEVLKVLKMTPINVDNNKLILNIANQIALPFLLDKPATFRSKLFNKLTGSDIVDKALQSLNRDILRIGKEERIEKESVEEKKKQLKELMKEKAKIRDTYEKVSKIFASLKEKQEKHSQLKDFLQKINNIRNEIKKIDENLKDIKLIDENTFINLKSSIDKLDNYWELSNNLKNNKQELKNVNEEISKLRIPKIDIVDLKNKTKRLDKLNEIKSKLQDIRKLREEIVLNIAESEALIERGQVEYKELQKKVKICPIFGGAISEECLKRIKL